MSTSTVRTTAGSAAFGARPWSRRLFLGTLAALSVGAAAGCDFSDTGQDFAGSGGAAGGRPRGSGSAAAGYSATPPLSLQVDCELSGDYFLVTNHRIDPKNDTVVAYSRADGDVEGVVLQDGVVKQVYRDPTQPGGWNVDALPDADGVLQMVAGISGPITSTKVPATLKVFYSKKTAPNTLFIATETPRSGTGAPSFTTTSIPWAGALAEVRLARNGDNGLLVTSIVASTSRQTTDGRLYYYTDSTTKDHGNGQDPVPCSGILTGFAYNPRDNTPINYLKGSVSGWSAVVAAPSAGAEAWPSLYLYVPQGTYGDTTNSFTVGKFTETYPGFSVWSWPLVAGATTTPAPMSPPWSSTGMKAAPAAPGTPDAYSIENAVVLGDARSAPSLLVRTYKTAERKQQLWVASYDAQHPSWTWTELLLPLGIPDATPVVLSTALRPTPSAEAVVATKIPATNFLDVFVAVGDATHTLSVIRQAPQNDAAADLVEPAFCPPIPLQPDVATMTSQAGRSTGNELLVVGTDGTLQTLLKDPATGHWADAVLQLPASELQQASAYRVELTVQDFWNTGVANQALTVTASTPVTALVSGQTVNLGTAPVTLSTDGQGQAVIALLADGLSAPTLTIEGSNLPTATVNPSAPINTFVQGGTPLNYQPPLTPDTLTNAQTPDGQIVAPGLSDADAKDGVANMSTAATWAASPTLTAARRSATLTRRDGHLGGRNVKGHPITVTGVASDIDNWVHDALHAIKKAAVGVTSIAFDAAKKTFTLVGDFAQWAEKALTIVIHGIEDAAHVIHAVLNKIGAALIKAIKWLEAEVLGLLRATAAVANQYETWIGQALTQVGAHLRKDATDVDSWLVAQQDSITSRFAAFAKSYPSSATLSSMASSSAMVATSRSRSSRPGHPPRSRGGRVGEDSGPSTDTPHSSWLFNKVKNELTGTLAVTPISNAEKLLGDFGGAAGQALKDFAKAFEELLSFFESVITHPQDVNTVGVQKLLTVLTDLTKAVFTFVRGVVTATMGLFAELATIIPAMLATPLEEALGVVGKLLGLIGLGNVTIGKLVALLFAFPTVLAYKIVHGSTAVPFGLSVAGQRRPGRVGDASADLQFCAGSALGIWAGFDTLSAAMTATDVPSPMLFTAVDIAAPVIVSVLTVPQTSSGEPFTAPPVGSDSESQMNFAAWILGLLPAFNVATGLYIDQKSSASTSDKDTWTDSLLWLTSGCGIGSLITGCVGNGLDPNPTTANYAGAVLNNMANIFAPGLGPMAKDTDGVSAAVALALTATCGSNSQDLWIGASHTACWPPS